MPGNADNSPFEDGLGTFRSYTSAFVLDGSKLNRIVAIAEERFRAAGYGLESRIDVQLKNGKEVTLGQVEDLLGLDNSVANPITSLSIVFCGTKGDKGVPVSAMLSYRVWAVPGVSFRLTGGDPKWISRFFAEVEEQIERTLVRSWVHRLKASAATRMLLLLVLGMLSGLALVSAFVALMPHKSPTNRDILRAVESIPTLAPSELARFREVAAKCSTLEEKVDLLFQLEKTRLAGLPREATPTSVAKVWIGSALSLKTLFVVLPFVVIAVAFVLLYWSCYPVAVFAWGDWQEHYDRLLSMRRTLWTVVIVSMLIGIVSGLFVFGLSEILWPRA